MPKNCLCEQHFISRVYCCSCSLFFIKQSSVLKQVMLNYHRLNDVIKILLLPLFLYLIFVTVVFVVIAFVITQNWSNLKAVLIEKKKIFFSLVIFCLSFKSAVDEKLFIINNGFLQASALKIFPLAVVIITLCLRKITEIIGYNITWKLLKDWNKKMKKEMFQDIRNNNMGNYVCTHMYVWIIMAH